MSISGVFSCAAHEASGDGLQAVLRITWPMELMLKLIGWLPEFELGVELSVERRIGLNDHILA